LSVPVHPSISPINSIPEKGVTEPVNTELEVREKLFPLDSVPVIELEDLTVPCTESLSEPPLGGSLAGVA
jgi:hypothetical protein